MKNFSPANGETGGVPTDLLWRGLVLTVLNPGPENQPLIAHRFNKINGRPNYLNRKPEDTDDKDAFDP